MIGTIDRSSGNIESLTEEIIALGVPDENILDTEYERMMDKIDNAINEEVPARVAVGAQNLASADAVARPDAVVETTDLAKSQRHDSFEELRHKLVKAYDRSGDSDKNGDV